METLMGQLTEFSLQVYYLIPVGIIGIWRWLVWLFRKLLGLRYQTIDLNEEYAEKTTASFIIPVYNEEPDVFRDALISWQAEGPDEIIAVIDHTDEACITIFREFAAEHDNAKLIVTTKSGKRAALVDGMKAASSDIIALIDSDSIWRVGVLPLLKSPFADPAVGGVGTRQNVRDPQSLAQRLFDVHLDSRYFDEIRFLAATGDALTCLSGRTAVYRREAVLPVLDELENETFFGKQCISGDDKRLTHLVQAAGWSVRYQEEARVFTPGSETMRSFLKQRLRWTRNSWRADLRALWDGWAWKKPALAFHLVDRIFQPITTLIAPIYMGIATYQQNWLAVIALVIWWLISRTVKLWPHMQRNRRGILILPAYIFFSWVFAIFKIFAFFTMNQQGWITRWDSSRLGKVRQIRIAPAYVATLAIFSLLCIGMVQFDTAYERFIDERRFYSEEVDLPNYNIAQVSTTSLDAMANAESTGAINPNQGLTNYELDQNESTELLVGKYGLDPEAVINESDNWEDGTPIKIQLPFKDSDGYRSSIGSDSPMSNISYLPESNTLFITGRGSVIDIPTLKEQIDDKRILEYKGDGVYLLKANILLENFTTLIIEGPDVTWLQLESNTETFAKIESIGGSIFISDVQVSSWDSINEDYDHVYEDGRGYVLIRNARMDIINSEMAYLGYSLESAQGKGGVYGVSWRITNEEKFGLELTTGYVENSKFHHNYFGVYTFGATGMIFRHNEFNDNHEYGFDPHDDSNNFIIEYNHAYNNGNHGMIVSKRCVNNVFRYNLSENNELHGIMLDRQSNNNTIYGNTLINNRDGVAIWDSHDNLIFDNEIVGNTRGVRLNRLSSGNIVYENNISESPQYGVYIYDEANENQVFDNQMNANETAVYLRADENSVSSNDIEGGKRGIFLTEEANENHIFANTLLNVITGIYLKTDPDDFIFDNIFVDNENNIEITSLWRIVVTERSAPATSYHPVTSVVGAERRIDAP